MEMRQDKESVEATKFVNRKSSLRLLYLERLTSFQLAKCVTKQFCYYYSNYFNNKQYKNTTANYRTDMTAYD